MDEQANQSLMDAYKAAPRWQQTFLQLLIFVSLLAGSFAAMEWAKEAYQSTQPPSTEAEAVKRMIGIWTYTEPIDSSVDTFPGEWKKLDIQPGGKVMVYRASPADSDWGKPEVMAYKTITDKYTDTGERWFGIRLGETVLMGIYRDNKIILHHPAYTTSGAMEKGDKTPFSR